MTAGPRHNTWPTSKARRHLGDEPRFWALLPLRCIVRARELESNLCDLLAERVSLNDHILPHVSIRWSSPHDILGHRRLFQQGRRSQSLEPEPTSADTELNQIVFTRVNSASPESSSQGEPTNNNNGSLFVGIGAGLASQHQVRRRPGHDGTMTPDSQSIVLSPHYRSSRASSIVRGLSAIVHAPVWLAFSPGHSSSHCQSSQVPTDTSGSPQPSASGVETRNRSDLKNPVTDAIDEQVPEPMTEIEAPAHRQQTSVNETGDPSSSRKRKRSRSSDADDQDTRPRRDDPCPCCKRLRSEHTE